MAVSLNLTVGILGELSLGHAGFHERGRFCRYAGVRVSLYGTTFAERCSVAAGHCWWAALWPVFSVSWSASLCCVCQGDYLAIVTLAFGEIIKNFINACYVGMDANGLHFSLKDTASLNLDADGKVIINGAMGITGIKKASTFTGGHRADSHHAGCHPQPDQLPRRPRHHVHP